MLPSNIILIQVPPHQPGEELPGSRSGVLNFRVGSKGRFGLKCASEGRRGLEAHSCWVLCSLLDKAVANLVFLFTVTW